MQRINDALELGDVEMVYECLHSPAIGLQNLQLDEKLHYFNILSRLKHKHIKVSLDNTVANGLDVSFCMC